MHAKENSETTYKTTRNYRQAAHIKNLCEYEDLREWAEEDYEGFWAHFAKEKLSWKKAFHTVLDESNAPFYKWFDGGTLNVSEQCIDRHLETKQNKAAIIFEGERGDREVVTYLELSYRVNKTANLLKNIFHIQKGDRVVIYMPMIPETAVMMLACARIGAIHSVVFGGFSAEALRSRIEDGEAKLVITADGAFRRGAPYLLKPVVDDALSEGCASVQSVLIVERNNEEISYVSGRDYLYNELIEQQSKQCIAEEMTSEDPLFLLYTSGSTGKPKGVQHAQAGYILWAQMTMEWVFDVRESDTFWCSADVGWITGHTYVVYGPLAAGATTVMYEGVPTYPDEGRWWSMIDHYRVTQFYTAPTAIRMLLKAGHDEPKKYDLSSLRVLGTVGEPINPDAWKWYHKEVGAEKTPIVDTWWQTETGGHLISPLPAATPTKPGSACFPLPGIMAEVLHEDGTPVKRGERGLLCVTKPWPSMIRTVWNDPERFKKGYYGVIEGVYFSGDGARVDEDGYIWVTGRVDDVLNVSGHRIGTAEVEAAIGKCPLVAESAVVGKADETKGESLFAFVIPRKIPKNDAEEFAFVQAVNEVVVKEIGAFAKLGEVKIATGLPKTRSGKIMRRILRSIAKGEEITQDISTLEDPSIITALQK